MITQKNKNERCNLLSNNKSKSKSNSHFHSIRLINPKVTLAAILNTELHIPLQLTS